jgi:hypothetical protein
MGPTESWIHMQVHVMNDNNGVDQDIGPVAACLVAVT